MAWDIVYYTPAVPAYIASMAANSGKQLSTKISDAFGTFTNQYGDRLSVLGYSGAAYDSVRGRIMHMGEGHQDGNANAVYGLTLYDTESPAWERFKDYSTPPDATPQASPAAAGDTLNGVSAPGAGDPVAFHSYHNLHYDAHNDRLVLFGQPSIFSLGGGGLTRIRSLSSLGSSPPLWDALTARPSKGTQGQGSTAIYDPATKCIYGKECQVDVNLGRYDAQTDSFDTLADGLGTWNIDVAVACKPGAYIVCIGGFSNGSPLDGGGADMVLFDLTSISGGNITAYSRTVGVPGALQVAKGALEYHPPSGNFVAWVGGNTIHVLTPPSNPFTDAWTFSTRTPTGDALPSVSTDSLGGVYSKFKWCPAPINPSLGVFAMTVIQGSSGSYTAANTHLYKPNF